MAVSPEMWITLSAGLIAFGATSTAAVLRYGGGKKGNSVCKEHSGLKANVENNQKDIAEIKGDLKTVVCTTSEIKGIVEQINNRRRTD